MKLRLILGLSLVLISSSLAANNERGEGKVLTIAYSADEEVARRLDHGVNAWNNNHRIFAEVRDCAGHPKKLGRNETLATVMVEFARPGYLCAFIFPFAGAKQMLVTGDFRDRSNRTEHFAIKMDSRLLPGGPPLRVNVAERVGCEIASRAGRFAMGS